VSPQHIVIVGAGHAGGCAAHALRAAGFPGRVTIVGAERYPPYERPPLSKELLAGAISVEKTYLRGVEWYLETGIHLRLTTEVVGIDRSSQRVRLSTGESLPYDAMLLTTGARPRRLTFAAGNDPRIFYIRDIEDTLALRDQLRPGVRLVIIGAGFIGLEVAATARGRDCNVTVLELAAYPLARVAPPEIGEHVAELHRRNGVDLQLNCSVDGIGTAARCCAIHTADGRTIEADIIAVGIGVVPDTALGAAAGLAVDDGIVVDQFGRTNDPCIFAAGDVTKHFNPLLGRAIRLEAWQNAQNQAIAVAKVMAGGSDAFAEVPWLWTDQHGMNMQIAGAPIEWDELVYRGEPSSGSFMLFQLLCKTLVGAISVHAGRDMRFARMLIASGKPVDPDELANSKTRLQDLCR
jgi:NADPH-dependent 2,4-dienoyl-CoA reductase/sulfur reductase-like enzyme